MIHQPLTETYCFLTLLLTGAASAAVYESCGFFRRLYSGVIVGLFLDLVFSAATVVLLFFSLQKACGGEIRLYTIAGFILGFCLIKRAFSLKRQLQADNE